MYTESIVKTDKLYCNTCKAKITKGDTVVFELNSNMKMKNVYGERCGCKKEYTMQVIEDSIHPFSSEAIGQE